MDNGTSNTAGVPAGTYNGDTCINGTLYSISNVTLDSYDITTDNTNIYQPQPR